MTTRKTKLNGLEFLNSQGRITLNDKSKVRLYSNENKSKYYISKKYSNDSGNYGYPNSKLIAEVAKELEAHGIRRLHVVDLDGAVSHHVVNYRTLEQIASRTSLVIDILFLLVYLKTIVLRK